MAWTREQFREHQREYRRRLKAYGGKRVDLRIDGALNHRLALFLAEYGYDTHPGYAIWAYLNQEAPRKTAGIK